MQKGARDDRQGRPEINARVGVMIKGLLKN